MGAAIIPALISGGLNLGGGLLNTLLGQKSSASSYQRMVEDLRKAGLNPALAYGRGGESTVEGKIGDVGDSVMQGSQLGLQKQQVAADVAQKSAQTRLLDAQTNQLNLESAGRRMWWDEGGQLRGAQTQLTQQQYGMNQTQWQFLKDTFGDRAAQVAASLALTREQAGYTGVQRALGSLQLPEAENVAAAQRKFQWFFQNVAPFMGTAKAVTGMFGDVMSPLKWLNFGGRNVVPPSKVYHFHSR